MCQVTQKSVEDENTGIWWCHQEARFLIMAVTPFEACFRVVSLVIEMAQRR
jgi:hypothetical protein